MFQFHPLRESEAKEYLALMHEAFDNDGEEPTFMCLEEFLRLLTLARMSGNQIYTMTDETHEILLGTGKLIFDHKFYHNAGLAIHIEDVAISKAFRGKGYGKQLIKFLVDCAQKMHAYKIVLNCNLDTVPFYERCGFQEEGTQMIQRFPKKD